MTSSRNHSRLSGAAPGSSPRSGAVPAGSDWFAGQLGRVASTLILGGGVFAMPLVAPLVGLIPFVAVLVGVWLVLKHVLYPRTAETLISSGSGGGDGLAAAVARAGGGRAGWLLCLNGVVVYVLGAAFGYATIGHTALAAIMDTVGRSGASTGGLVIVGVGLGAVAWLAPQSLPERLLGPVTLMSVWAIGLGLTTLLPDASGSAGLDWHGLGYLATFFAGVVLIGFQRATSTSDRARPPASDPCRLERGHRISLTAQTTQLVLMGVLLATVLLWGAAGESVPFSSPTLWRMPSFAEFVRVVGVLLFAQVGTGWNNFARYPAMCVPAFRRRVVDRAMWVVLAVQIGWLVPILWIVPTAGLRNADAAHSQSAAALAQVAGGALPAAVATTLALLAALVVLVGVTSACAGFVESLASETSNTWRALSGRPGPARAEQAFLALAAVGAAVLLMTGASVSAVLAVAGIAGGGIIIFVQPMLAGVHRRSQPGWRRAAIISAVAITLLGTVDVMLRHVPLPWGGAALLIAFLPLVLTVATSTAIRRNSPAEPEPRPLDLSRVPPKARGAATGNSDLVHIDTSSSGLPGHGGADAGGGPVAGAEERAGRPNGHRGPGLVQGLLGPVRQVGAFEPDRLPWEPSVRPMAAAPERAEVCG